MYTKNIAIVGASEGLFAKSHGYSKCETRKEAESVAINLKSTATLAANGVKVLVYGQAGAGKTYLIQTLPNPIILSAESGLLSLQGTDLPYIEIANMATLAEAYQWLTGSEEARGFESVALDSLSEIAEVVLSAEKKNTKDSRQAYGAMQDQMAELIRAFRDMPNKNVYFSAKVEKSQDEMGNILFYPSLPGNKMTQSLPYFFDEVLALRVERDSEGKVCRALQCVPDGVWLAKDRSSRLEMWEEADLGKIFKKIGGESDN